MLERIKSWFYRPAFFQAHTFQTGQALKFYSLMVLVSVVVTTLGFLPGVWRLHQSMRSGAWSHQEQIVRDLYPNNLEITIDHGILQTNQNHPVVITFPKEWQGSYRPDPRKQEFTEPLPDNLLVIDTDTPVTPDRFTSEDTLIIMGKSEMGYHDLKKGETRIFDLDKAGFKERFTMTPSDYQYWLSKGLSILKTIMLGLLILAPFFLYAGLWTGYLFYSVFGALVVWLASNVLRDYKLTYSQAYLSTLFLLPVPLVLGFVMFWFHIFVPFAFTVVLFLMALINFPKRETMISQNISVTESASEVKSEEKKE